MTRRRLRSVAPIALSMPRARSRRWAITEKLATDTRPTNAKPSTSSTRICTAGATPLTCCVGSDTIAAGMDTIAGDRGYRFSGGEKQRLALARLLLKAPSVVVLDEATAHLDSESEVAMQQALKTALSGRTSLVIAHRLSTIREADQILVIDDGEVRERGTHDSLLAG